MSAADPAPELTVVVPFVNELDDVLGCLAALAREAERTRLEVIVAERRGPEAAEAIQARFPGVRIIPAPAGTTIPALRALAFEAATAPAVAVIEDHVIVPDGWCRRALDALARGRQAAAGPITNAATERLVDRAAFLMEYAPLLPPVDLGPADSLPGNNTVYQADLLRRHRDVVAEGRWEDRLHAALRQDGVTLWRDPGLLANHRMHYTVQSYTEQRYLYSRAFAGMRIRGAGLAHRAALGTGALLLPPLLLWRVMRAVWPRREHRRDLVATLPLLAWWSVVWAAGEAVGYWLGPGTALARVR